MRQTPAAPALRGSDVETEQDTQIFSGVPQMTLTRFRGFLVGGSCHKIQGLKQVSVTGDLSPDYGNFLCLKIEYPNWFLIILDE